jgi:hypothetical protein
LQGGVSNAIGQQVVSKSFWRKGLRFLIRFGTRIAFQYGVNTEMNQSNASSNPAMDDPDGVILDGDGVRSIRRRLHELANAFTGVMIAGGLLSQYLEGGSLAHYASDICEGSERGCVLVREIRSQLLAAQGEAEAAPNGNPIK